MSPVQTDWAVVPWQHQDDEPPSLPSTTIRMPDGSSWLVSEAPDPAWLSGHTRRGAEIADAFRGVTYRATIDRETGELDHLEVILSDRSRINENLLRRVPVERIRRVVLQHLIEDEQANPAGRDGEQVLVFTLPGGLTDPSQTGQVPPAEEIAELMNRGLGRQEIAKHYRRPVRTIDRWIRDARRSLPDRVPPARPRRPNLPRPPRQGQEGER